MVLVAPNLSLPLESQSSLPHCLESGGCGSSPLEFFLIEHPHWFSLPCGVRKSKQTEVVIVPAKFLAYILPLGGVD